MPETMRIALLQMDIAIGKPEDNFAKLERKLSEIMAQDKKPDIITFPEMWNTGYALEEIQQLADENGMRTKRLLSEFCRTHSVNIVAGSIAEKVGSDIRNTTYVFDRQGQLLTEYSKIHLFGLMNEDKYLSGGNRISIFELDGQRASSMICYDLRFPELARKTAISGAKMLFIPAEWPQPRLHHWRSLILARAIENQMYIVACNRCGISGTTEFFGHSMVVDPWGEILAEGGEEETALSVEIDLAEVDRVRTHIPVFTDRRPHLY